MRGFVCVWFEFHVVCLSLFDMSQWGGGIHDKKTGTTHLAELKRSTVCDVESSTSIMIIVLILNDNAVQTTHPDKIIDILVLLIVLLLLVVVGIVVVVGCLCVCHDGGSRSGGGDIG